MVIYLAYVYTMAEENELHNQRYAAVGSIDKRWSLLRIVSGIV